MRFLTLAAALSSLSSGCVYSHLEDSYIASETTPVEVSGYAGIASDEVTLEALQPWWGGSWVALDTTTSGTFNGNPNGYALYGYNFDPVVVPSTYWNSGSCVNLRVTENGQALAVFEGAHTVGSWPNWTVEDGYDCLSDEYNANGNDWYQAGSTCQAGTTFEICVTPVIN